MNLTAATREDEVLKTITLAAVLSAVSVTLASAQSVDPNGANRGYPVYAQPNSSAYYNGTLQGFGGASGTKPVRLRGSARRRH